jgi:hypothetical protein
VGHGGCPGTLYIPVASGGYFLVNCKVLFNLIPIFDMHEEALILQESGGFSWVFTRSGGF